MSFLEDGMYIAYESVVSTFAALDSHILDGFSLLDYLLAFMAFVFALEFVLYMLGVDVDVWSYVYGNEDDDDNSQA